MPHVPPHLVPYVLGYSGALVLSLMVFVLRPGDFEVTHLMYRRFLSRPWRRATFVLSAGAVTLAAPYSGDPTWDIPDSILISVLTFVLAPWAVGRAWRSIRSRDFLGLALIGIALVSIRRSAHQMTSTTLPWV